MKKILLLLVFSPWTQAFVTVGTDGACNYTPASLEFAIQTNDEVRITNQVEYDAIEIINRSAHLMGGYDDCTDANNDVPGINKSQISGNSTSTALRITTTAAAGHPRRTVYLKNIEVHSGSTSSPNVSGGVDISGNMDVTIERSIIRNNQADNLGGGIYLSGMNGANLTLIWSDVLENSASQGGGVYLTANAQLILENSRISDNNATHGGGVYISSSAHLQTIYSYITGNNASFSGGGINCNTNAKVYMDDDSRLGFNVATNNGGGLMAQTGCYFKISGGDNTPDHQTNPGIRFNTAGLSGGGVYANNATIMIIGPAEHYANVVLNRTLHEHQNGRGGAIYATGGQAVIRLVNARVNRNQSDIGSAVFLTQGAYMNMKRSTGQCFGNQLCSEVFDNEATYEGTIVASNCAIAEIYQTTFRDNIAPKSAVLGLYGDGVSNECESTFEGNLVYNNQDDISETQSLFSLNNQSILNFAFNTVTDNLTDSVFQMDDFNDTAQTLKINSSLIWNIPAADITASAPNHHYSGNCFTVPNPQNLPAGFGQIVNANDPVFEDPQGNIYELTLFSPPLDYCDTSLYKPKHHDIIGVPRGFQIVAPILGTYDMGAFEFNNVNNNDVIFADYFD